MNIMILNPDFPKDKSKARALTKEQFAVVHDYIVGQLNTGKPIKDQTIVDKLIEAKLPIDFSPVTVCSVCKKNLKPVTLEGGRVLWKATADADQDMAQYCWVDPELGSGLHKEMEI